MYEFFDHTADLGLRIQTTELADLFVEAAQAMFTAIVEDLSSIRPDREIQVALDGDAVDYLLFDWLKELLFQFDADHLLLGKFAVTIDESGLQGRAWGEALDHDRHILDREVKAITYHGLRVEQNNGGWLAEIIVDI